MPRHSLHHCHAPLSTAAPKPPLPRGVGPRARAACARAPAALAAAIVRVGELARPPLLRTTALLIVIWLTNALVYYSLVLLATSASGWWGRPRRVGEGGASRHVLRRATACSRAGHPPAPPRRLTSHTPHLA